MPIYEYECLSCGKHEEAFQKISEKPLTKCPHCSGKLQKLISQSSFHLKGSGWYITDYANKKNSNTSTSSEKSGGTDASADASKKQSKAAETTSES